MAITDFASDAIPTFGGLGALVSLFVWFMRMTSQSNARVDTITGGQIQLLRDEKEKAERERERSAVEAEKWDQMFHTELNAGTSLRIRIGQLESEVRTLQAEIDRLRGMGPNDGRNA